MTLMCAWLRVGIVLLSFPIGANVAAIVGGVVGGVVVLVAVAVAIIITSVVVYINKNKAGKWIIIAHSSWLTDK